MKPGEISLVIIMRNVSAHNARQVSQLFDVLDDRDECERRETSKVRLLLSSLDECPPLCV
jgi:hypothetical protein